MRRLRAAVNRRVPLLELNLNYGRWGPDTPLVTAQGQVLDGVVSQDE